MDAMVSARIPVEVKRQGDALLKKMGSSVTELINSAYDYLVANGELPGKASPLPNSSEPGETLKTLEGNNAAAFIEAWDSRAVFEAPDYDGTNFKQLLDDARGERHARFA